MASLNIATTYHRVLEAVRRGKLDHLTPDDWDVYSMITRVRAEEMTDA